MSGEGFFCFCFFGFLFKPMAEEREEGKEGEKAGKRRGERRGRKKERVCVCTLIYMLLFRRNWFISRSFGFVWLYLELSIKMESRLPPPNFVE